MSITELTAFMSLGLCREHSVLLITEEAAFVGGEDVDPNDPKPVGCDAKLGIAPAPVGWAAGGEGVAGAEGMGGRLSRSAAPNEDDGLNAFRPLNPVVCRCSGAAPPADEIEIDGAPPEMEVAPVGWDETEEKRVSENVEPVVVLDVG